MNTKKYKITVWAFSLIIILLYLVMVILAKMQIPVFGFAKVIAVSGVLLVGTGLLLSAKTIKKSSKSPYPTTIMIYGMIIFEAFSLIASMSIYY